VSYCLPLKRSGKGKAIFEVNTKHFSMHYSCLHFRTVGGRILSSVNRWAVGRHASPRGHAVRTQGVSKREALPRGVHAGLCLCCTMHVVCDVYITVVCLICEGLAQPAVLQKNRVPRGPRLEAWSNPIVASKCRFLLLEPFQGKLAFEYVNVEYRDHPCFNKEGAKGSRRGSHCF